MLPACISGALARAGEAAVRTAGPASLRERLDAAMAGDLDDGELGRLRGELETFAEMLEGG